MPRIFPIRNKLERSENGDLEDVLLTYGIWLRFLSWRNDCASQRYESACDKAWRAGLWD